MHACMHACMYVCMYACMYVCMYGSVVIAIVAVVVVVVVVVLVVVVLWLLCFLPVGRAMPPTPGVGAPTRAHQVSRHGVAGRRRRGQVDGGEGEGVKV